MSPVDPRYDARFQRGFSGEGGGEGGGSPAAPTEGSAVTDARIEPLVTRASSESTDELKARMAAEELSRLLRPRGDDETGAELLGEGVAGGEAEAGAEADAEADDSAFGPQSGRNPWLITLWVVSIALIVVPIVFYWQSQYAQSGMSWTGNEPPVEFLINQIIGQLTPAVVTMGALGVIAAITFHALAWGSRGSGARKATVKP